MGSKKEIIQVLKQKKITINNFEKFIYCIQLDILSELGISETEQLFT